MKNRVKTIAHEAMATEPTPEMIRRETARGLAKLRREYGCARVNAVLRSIGFRLADVGNDLGIAKGK